mmetsp:Transcript_78502/g.230245  ORF Transcript_78502/g.230245 Transcript_78502/m.230245 type:complete len:226 (+) Transcript_78502:538-1215(+)
MRSPCLESCTRCSLQNTMKTCIFAVPATASRSSPCVTTLFEGISPPPPQRVSDSSFWLQPPFAHHCCTFGASGMLGLKTSSPSGSSEPARAPFHSLMKTLLSPITGWFLKHSSSCLARSAHSTTIMLQPDSSATVISRLASSPPSFPVMVMAAAASTTTPQRLALHGVLRVLRAPTVETAKLTAWICPSSSASSTCQNFSKASSYLWLVLLNCLFATRTLPLLKV